MVRKIFFIVVIAYALMQTPVYKKYTGIYTQKAINYIDYLFRDEYPNSSKTPTGNQNTSYSRPSYTYQEASPNQNVSPFRPTPYFGSSTQDARRIFSTPNFGSLGSQRSISSTSNFGFSGSQRSISSTPNFGFSGSQQSIFSTPNFGSLCSQRSISSTSNFGFSGSQQSIFSTPNFGFSGSRSMFPTAQSGKY